MENEGLEWVVAGYVLVSESDVSDVSDDAVQVCSRLDTLVDLFM